MRVHEYKIKALHTCTYLYEVSSMKRSCLQPVVPLTLQSIHGELFFMKWLPIYWDT